MPEDTRTLLVTETNGKQFKITIPADYKVTFGKQPGSSGRTPYEPAEPSLRIYENDSKQRACFVGIRSFRDLSLPVTRLVISEDGTSRWSSDGDGNTEQTKKVNRKLREVPDHPVPPPAF